MVGESVEVELRHLFMPNPKRFDWKPYTTLNSYNESLYSLTTKSTYNFYRGPVGMGDGHLLKSVGRFTVEDLPVHDMSKTCFPAKAVSTQEENQPPPVYTSNTQTNTVLAILRMLGHTQTPLTIYGEGVERRLAAISADEKPLNPCAFKRCAHELNPAQWVIDGVRPLITANECHQWVYGETGSYGGVQAVKHNLFQRRKGVISSVNTFMASAANGDFHIPFKFGSLAAPEQFVS